MGKPKRKITDAAVHAIFIFILTFVAILLLKKNYKYARNVSVGLASSIIVAYVNETKLQEREDLQLATSVMVPFTIFSLFGDKDWAMTATMLSLTTGISTMMADYYNRSDFGVISSSLSDWITPPYYGERIEECGASK